MRNAILFLILLVLAACDDISPVENVNLCEGDKPPSDECEQCKKPPFAADCPHCLANPDDSDCGEATDGGGGAGKGDSGKGGSGSSGKGGTGGSGMIGGDGGSSGSSGAGGGGSSGSGGKGGSGGKEASGGSGGGTAEPCSKCPKEKPNCFDDECVECAKASDCDGDAKLCDDDAHTCIECEDNDDCADNDDNKFCDTAAHACVECLGDGHCPSDSAPQCTGHKCGDCTDNDACTDHDGKTFCDKGSSSATKGECVECLEHADCDNPKPQCSSSHQCAPCSGNGACTRLGQVCNTRSNVETSGQCVDCTGANEDDKCNGKACNQHTGTCTDTTVGTVSYCKTCEADSECEDGSKCALQQYDLSHSLGPYCLPLKGEQSCAGPGNLGRRPFSKPVSLTSIDDTSPLDYCLPAASCPAYLDALSTVQPCDADSDCGESGLADGLCLDSEQCSYTCVASADCPPGPLSSCGASMVCGQ